MPKELPMNSFQLIVAVLAGLPALLTALGAFWHSVNTRDKLNSRIDRFTRP
jgi:hypothetical protein